jgi:HD-like signal output (HDOD) protein
MRLLWVLLPLLAVILWLGWLELRRPRAARAAARAISPALTDTPAEEPVATPVAGSTAAESATTALEPLRALQELALGSSLAREDTAAAAEQPIRSAITSRLQDIVAQPNYAPRRPLLLPRLMQAVHDEAISQREIAGIIASDPALAGNLLRLVNSPYYWTGAAVESMDRAVAVLGLDGMRRMIAAALLQPVFQRSSGNAAAFGEIMWQHAMYSATAAEAYAAIIENSDPFAAQLLALLMGLAAIVVFRIAREEFARREREAPAGTLALLLDAHWTPIARQIAASWNLSERIDAALAEQIALPLPGALTPASPLGRALQFGRYTGAVAVLRARNAIDEVTALAAVRAAPGAPLRAVVGQITDPGMSPYERIWSRLAVQPT